MCFRVVIKSHSFASRFVVHYFSHSSFRLISSYHCALHNSCTDTTAKHWNEKKPLCRSARRSPLWPNGRAEPSHKEEWRLEPTRQYGIHFDAKLHVTTKRGHAMQRTSSSCVGSMQSCQAHGFPPTQGNHAALNTLPDNKNFDMVKAMPDCSETPHLQLSQCTSYEMQNEERGIRVDPTSRDGYQGGALGSYQGY